MELSSTSKILGKLPLLVLIVGLVALGYIIFQQMGYDSRNVEVVDSETQEARDYRIISVLPRGRHPSHIGPQIRSGFHCHHVDAAWRADNRP